jgi:predicted dehydrogenase
MPTTEKLFRWGIFGTGAISTKFVSGLATAKAAKAVFVASRSLTKAQKFATAMGITRAIEGYDKAAATENVDAVYIATPPALHAEHALICIQRGIPVLVEKPFTSTAGEAQQIISAARGKSVFAMEALWTRFLPAAQAMREKIINQAIGEVRIITGNFGISQIPGNENALFNAKLGGGALAHLGVYPVSLAQWLFGTPKLIEAMGTVGLTGVDEDVAFQLRYDKGVIASFSVSMRSWAADALQISGTDGMLSLRGSIVRPYGLDISHEMPRPQEVTNFGWRANMRQNAWVHMLAQRFGRSSRANMQRHDYYYAGNGYHYQADEVRACISRGAAESTVMPLNDSLAVATTIDTIRNMIRREA